MDKVNRTKPVSRTGWPNAVLIVTAVSAVSVVLGLTVVGPMIQRRLETPPPALAATTVAAAPVAAPPKPRAQVRIKERVIPRPRPQPVPTELTLPLGDPNLTLTDPLASGSAPSDTQRRSGASPSIRATITDGESARDAVKREEKGSIRTEVTPSGDRPDRRAVSGSHTPAADKTKQRVAPLEALPDLGNSLPRGPGSEGETNPGTATSDNKTPKPSSTSGEGNGRVYRVQVGRFTDEADAKRLRDELAAPGSEPQVVKSERDGVVVYRVQVGTYRQEENAKRQLESLRAKSYEPYLAEDDK